ncbi:MAG: ATP phosphoribosyltransferase regulatory subunit [Campylobacterales bacterium]
MVLEHDIPAGGRLYIGTQAKLKRQLEGDAAEFFEERGYREIVTPYFSYHQQGFIPLSKLIRVADRENRVVTLRGDTSFDLIRLVLKRLKSGHQKWFYIQPVFRYPSREIYQIGAEWLEGNLEELLTLNLELFARWKVEGRLILSNQQITQWLIGEGVLGEGELKRLELYKFPKWVRKLAKISEISQLEKLEQFPAPLRAPLEELREIGEQVARWGVEPLLALVELPPFPYYRGIFFKFIANQFLIARGGRYQVKEVESVGFSIYTDQLLEWIGEKGINSRKKVE